jgi:hypothetical protein
MPSTTLLEMPLEEQAQMRVILVWTLIMASATSVDDVPGRCTYATEELGV